MAENPRTAKNKNTPSKIEEPRAKRTCEDSAIFSPGAYNDICNRFRLIEEKIVNIKNGSVNPDPSESYSIANKIDKSNFDTRLQIVSAFHFE